MEYSTLEFHNHVVGRFFDLEVGHVLPHFFD
jgi:hypothetical protein